MRAGLVWLAIAAAAFAQDDAERPIDGMPWNTSIAEALAEAEDRGAPIAVYVYKDGEEGDAPVAIAASEATRTIWGFSLLRIDVLRGGDALAEFMRRWGATCSIEKLPAVFLFAPDGGPSAEAVLPAADGKALRETCEAVLARLGRPPVEAGFYRNAKAGHERGAEAMARGDARTAMRELEVVVAIAANCGRDFRFTDGDRKAYQRLVEEARARVEGLRKAIGAKDWKTVWRLGHELAEAYRQTELEGEVTDLLVAAEADPDAAKAFETLSAEEEKARTEAYLVEVAKHRSEAIREIGAGVSLSEIAEDQIQVVFWDEALLSLAGRPGDEDRMTNPLATVHAVGAWLGSDRAVMLLADPAGGADDLHDLVARDDVERRVFALMREQARVGVRPVVPIAIKPGDHGKLIVTACDGWDGEAGGWSLGCWAVDVAAGTVEDRGRER